MVKPHHRVASPSRGGAMKATTTAGDNTRRIGTYQAVTWMGQTTATATMQRWTKARERKTHLLARIGR